MSAIAVKHDTAAQERRRTRPIGLLAGSGRFPILFAEAAASRVLRVACVGIRYEASEELRGLCDSFQYRRGRQAGRDDPNVPSRGRLARIVMAGKVTKSVMYTPWRMLQLCPDLRTIQWWYSPQPRRQSRRQPAAQRDRRVRAGWDDVRLGPGLLPGATREGRHSHSASADRRAS